LSTWNPDTYLKFERERTLPCHDLVSRIELDAPARIADLGCGPGNSTAVLAERWPNAKLVGIDNSNEMLKTARASKLFAEWDLADIHSWNPSDPFDLVFSNAALQWVPDHKVEIPRLFESVAPRGALAFQIPTHTDLWFSVLQNLTRSDQWKGRLGNLPPDFYSHDLGFYYNLLCDRSKRIDLWETEYYHILPSPETVVEWTRGTALRPLLERLDDEKLRKSFVEEYTVVISRAYARQRDGNILFTFLRRFVVAYAM
jgi:trans-aconitate 2-methyltransferase